MHPALKIKGDELVEAFATRKPDPIILGGD
jgi:hypothetical protein